LQNLKTFEIYIRWTSNKKSVRPVTNEQSNRLKMAVFNVVAPCTTLTMQAANTSVTSANFYQTTRRNNPEDNHRHTRRRENLKSHQATNWLVLVYLPTLQQLQLKREMIR
jgi:transcriptional regulator of nitric oxide reductase